MRPDACVVHHGDCLDVLRGMPEASVDAVVTDPPAGISFMGREWDHHKGGRDLWIAWMAEVAAECLRVAKPGAHALVWSLPRTSHWTATAWEDAGWTVRDRVSHIFGTGFPKSADVSKQIDKAAGAEREVVGFGPDHAKRTPRPSAGANSLSIAEGTLRLGPNPYRPRDRRRQAVAGLGDALKPAVEDWWLLRKPLAEPTVAANVLKHGTGAINVDACRVPTGECLNERRLRHEQAVSATSSDDERPQHAARRRVPSASGRWPANLVHDGSPEVLDAFAAFGPARSAGNYPSDSLGRDGTTSFKPRQGALYADSGTAARFFYSAKASKAERAGSKHPTVKPVALMRWLCRLITPPSGTVLDPFAGSPERPARPLSPRASALS
jgi:hypothetical protein